MVAIHKIHNLEIDKDFPLDIREKYFISIDKIVEIGNKIQKLTESFFILSTCNRVSIYFIDGEPTEIQNILFPKVHCKSRKGIEAIKHFFKVACGLESQVFAETDIIHQIKQYYKSQKSFVGQILDQMINFSFTVHKEFHTSILPKIKRQKQNLANIVWQRIKNLPSEIPVILIGYGILNKSIHKIIKNHFKNILIFSDNNKKAYPKKLIHQKLGEIQDKCIIISATNTSEPIIDKKSRIPYGSIIFDLSVPRSIDSQITSNYIDLDGLREKQTNVYSDELIIHDFLNQKVNEFIDKIIILDLKAIIKKFYKIPLEIAEEKINQYYKELMSIIKTEDEKEIKEFFKYINQKIVNQTLEEPIKKIKELYIQSQKRKIIVGTRGSRLALAQTEEILSLLKLNFPEFEFSTEIIKTSGDKNIYTSNSFVKELEEALIREEIDIAVHSLKDIPYQINNYLEVAAIPLRSEPNDVLITRDGKNFWEMKPNSVIGTSSLRRRKQLEILRKDIIVKDLRGNVDTRIRKLFEGQYDGIILALAAIKRLNLEKLISYIFPIDEMVPAPGQGAIAIQTRKQSFLTELMRKLDNPTYREETNLERYFMGLLNLGCSFPLGACCQKKENHTEFHYFLNIHDKIFKQKIINPNIEQIIQTTSMIKT
ncbi:MAG: hydroxymethylbilane synthase [Candidatus Calescibacterium sp.]|nr:hydroxymethylbilane synthase [Candidatus Calescibacterium sp.]MCX7971663.1 hydroxymethylbilane synthase [bacterium]MDW8195269.1 hydroxymethylbilane synthase [Candidatus Calescibacterium sp.]